MILAIRCEQLAFWDRILTSRLQLSFRVPPRWPSYLGRTILKSAHRHFPATDAVKGVEKCVGKVFTTSSSPFWTIRNRFASLTRCSAGLATRASGLSISDIGPRITWHAFPFSIATSGYNQLPLAASSIHRSMPPAFTTSPFGRGAAGRSTASIKISFCPTVSK